MITSIDVNTIGKPGIVDWVGDLAMGDDDNIYLLRPSNEGTRLFKLDSNLVSIESILLEPNDGKRWSVNSLDHLEMADNALYVSSFSENWIHKYSSPYGMPCP